MRELALEAVVTEIEVFDVPEVDDGGREGPVELIVTDIELEEVAEAGEVGDGVGEVVAVGVEEGEVGELVGEAADGRRGERQAVEVHAGDGAVAGLGRSVAGEALVVANVLPGPGLGHAVGVAGDGALEALDY